MVVSATWKNRVRQFFSSNGSVLRNILVVVVRVVVVVLIVVLPVGDAGVVVTIPVVVKFARGVVKLGP